jgi:hypothetical protein
MVDAPQKQFSQEKSSYIFTDFPSEEGRVIVDKKCIEFFFVLQVKCGH